MYVLINVHIYVCRFVCVRFILQLAHWSTIRTYIFRFYTCKTFLQKRITDNQLELFESSKYNYYMYITKTGSKLCLKPLPGRGSWAGLHQSFQWAKAGSDKVMTKSFHVCNIYMLNMQTWLVLDVSPTVVLY